MQTIVFITEMIKLDNFPQSAVSYRIFSDLNCKQWSATGKGYKCWTNSKLLFTHLYLTYLILSNKIRCSRLIYQNKMSATVRCIFQCDNKFTRKRDIDAFYILFLVTAHPEAAGFWRALAGCFLPSQSEQFKTGIPNIAFLSLDRNVQESRTNKQTNKKLAQCYLRTPTTQQNWARRLTNKCANECILTAHMNWCPILVISYPNQIQMLFKTLTFIFASTLIRSHLIAKIHDEAKCN